MRSRGEISVRLIAAGVLAIVAAFGFGLQTPNGGPDWVAIVMAAAGLVIVAAGVIPRFRSGPSHSG
jgi:hypothetical protein